MLRLAFIKRRFLMALVHSNDQTRFSEQAPLVSVVMSMLDSACTVHDAIRSVLLQTLSDWEMIVIDNGSSDGTAAIVRGFDDPRIRLVTETSTVLLATRLNQAIALSRGRFIARMDADDVCFPERLERQVARLQQEPGLDVVGCGAVVFRENTTLVGQLPLAITHDEIVARPFIGFPFPHPTWCGRREWFLTNPYDTQPGTAEDQDLLLRSFRASHFASVNEVLLGYRQNQLSLRKLINGRRAFIGSLWRNERQPRDRAGAFLGIATHFIKGFADVCIMQAGLGEWAQRYRLQTISPSVPGRWQDLQDLLKAS